MGRYVMSVRLLQSSWFSSEMFSTCACHLFKSFPLTVSLVFPQSHCSELWRWKTVGMSRQECGRFSACGDHEDHECVLWVSQPRLQNAHTPAATGTLNCTGSQLSSGTPQGYPVLCSHSLCYWSENKHLTEGKVTPFGRKNKKTHDGQPCDHRVTQPLQNLVTRFFFFFHSNLLKILKEHAIIGFVIFLNN